MHSEIANYIKFDSNSKFTPKLLVVFGNLLDTGERTKQDSLLTLVHIQLNYRCGILQLLVAVQNSTHTAEFDNS